MVPRSMRKGRVPQLDTPTAAQTKRRPWSNTRTFSLCQGLPQEPGIPDVYQWPISGIVRSHLAKKKPPAMTSVGACGGFWVSIQHGPTSYSHQALGSMNSAISVWFRAKKKARPPSQSKPSPSGPPQRYPNISVPLGCHEKAPDEAGAQLAERLVTTSRRPCETR